MAAARAGASVSLVDEAIGSLQDLPRFLNARAATALACISVLNLHSNQIRSLLPTTHAALATAATAATAAGGAGADTRPSHLARPAAVSVLSLLSSLTVLDLSSNLIQSMLGIDAVPTLVDLNLSNNLIAAIDGLAGLRRLQRLNLSFNHISSLAGFVDMHGDFHSLASLDIKGNRISDPAQLKFLAGCTRLAELTLLSDHKTSRVNPMCDPAHFNPSDVFHWLPQIRSLDGRDMHGRPVVDDAIGLDGVDIREYEMLAQGESNPRPQSPPPQHPQPSRLPTRSSVAQQQPSQQQPSQQQSSQQQPSQQQPIQQLAQRLGSIEAMLAAIQRATTPVPPAANDSQRIAAESSVAEASSDRLASIEAQFAQLLQTLNSKIPTRESLQASARDTPTMQQQPQQPASQPAPDESRLAHIETQLTQLIGFMTSASGEKVQPQPQSQPQPQPQPQPASIQQRQPSPQAPIEDEIAKEQRRQHLLMRRRMTQAEPDVGQSRDDEDMLTIPARVPTVSASEPKKMSLVWIQEQPQRDGLVGDTVDTANSQSHRLQRPVSRQQPARTRIDVPGPSQQGQQSGGAGAKKSQNADRALAANARLIAALEQEEQRLRDNEMQYANKIRALVDELRSEREKARLVEPMSEQLKALRAHVEKQAAEVARLNDVAKSTRAELDGLTVEHAAVKTRLDDTATMLQQRSEEAAMYKGARDVLQRELDNRSVHLDTTQKQTRDMELQVKAVEAQLGEMETEHRRVTLKFVKEREQHKIKLAEVREKRLVADWLKRTDTAQCVQSKRETEMLQSSLAQMKSEVDHLREMLATRDADFQRHLDSVHNSHKAELNASIAEATKGLAIAHQSELARASDALMQARSAYHALEDEFRNAMKNEQHRYTELYRSHQQISDKQAHAEQSLRSAALREAELTTLIRDLSRVIKEQKAKIASVSGRNQEAMSALQDQVSDLQTRLGRAQAAKTELVSAQSVIAELRNELAAKSAALDHAHEQMRGRADDEAVKVKELARRLEDAVKGQEAAETDSKRLRDQAAQLDQAVRVKTKMLDDQNETIRVLKQNLDNKTREHQSLVKELDECQQELDELRHLDTHTVNDLRDEVNALQSAVDRYKTLAQDYRRDRDEMGKELQETRQRLADRNESIAKIEQEVARVHEHVRAKDERARAEKEAEIRDLKLSFEADKAKLEFMSASDSPWWRRWRGCGARRRRRARSWTDGTWRCGHCWSSSISRNDRRARSWHGSRLHWLMCERVFPMQSCAFGCVTIRRVHSV
ncbi:hypothetical protein BC831DRAFT_18866 [Entophlyctis helioformis]|nr:hypothetical protein BC831DRAFT_18866 [Entophlyctis helioformis]